MRVKRFVVSSFAVLSIFVFALSAQAQNKSIDASLEEPLVEITDYQTFAPPSIQQEKLPDSEYDPLYPGLTDANGKIKNIDEAKLKKGLLKHFNKHPESFKESIKNIDAVTQSYLKQLQNEKAKQENAANIGIQPMEVPICCYVTSEWQSGHPYTTSSTNYVHWQPWIIEDNWLSNLAITVSTELSTEVSRTIGFSGSADIKATLGFSAEYTENQKAVFTVGTTIPGHNIWAYRPWIKSNGKTWEGYMIYHYYNLYTSSWTYTSDFKSGTNVTLTSKGNQYWSAENPSPFTSPRPSPPSGAPW
ncbi:hypothetical protein [Cohnella soli]|uniref:Uncharacterized protein n=1 Tax=Cohnella soli TaxID=425005 RepID=A0ABW0HPZ6_9BACL